MPDSVTVFTEYTVLLLGLPSNATRMFRVGDIAINPGETPAPISETRASVSFWPFTNTNPPNDEVDVTPCEARTRSRRPLVVCLLEELPQELKFNPNHKPTAIKARLFFKPKAPNNLKKEDLLAKSKIITDRQDSLLNVLLTAMGSVHRNSRSTLDAVQRMRECGLILYPHKQYGR